MADRPARRGMFVVKPPHLSQTCPIWSFFERQKPQTPGFLEENRGFVFVECGGEGEIRNYPQSNFHYASPRFTWATAMLPPQKIGILSPMVVPWLLHQVSAQGLKRGKKRQADRFMLRHGKKVILVIRLIKKSKPL